MIRVNIKAPFEARAGYCQQGAGYPLPTLRGNPGANPNIYDAMWSGDNTGTGLESIFIR